MSRSPDLMNADDTTLLVVDVQTRLLATEPDGPAIVWNARRLLDAAAALGVPALATEQVPEKLGGTEGSLAQRLSQTLVKSAFSGCGAEGLKGALAAQGRFRVLLCGIETHVCVAQTALDLLAEGFRVYVALDAVSSRHAIDHATALRRMECAGVTLTTTEAAMFEWCADAKHEAFRKISSLVKEEL
ncbi:putative hydrolase [Pirellulimonas nuda]|uniref:Putative hydrolase n=1 Tax=Pirellulimonas nuda TaxID=2528009 RepID=A0A518DF00_9BACT|nr:isochorismatase family protein [Pirellulimonas nuda]QDU90057.1 putative hydrolase [Pirellulimonas nuda]